MIVYDRRHLWDHIYEDRRPDQVPWFQEEPTLSLELIRNTGAELAKTPIIDVGGGPSVLADRLLELGAEDLTVLDVSVRGMGHARKRLGPRGKKVHWLEADVTAVRSAQYYGLWHDRALFHFLTDPADRAAYVAFLDRNLVPGGHVVIATFAPDGPKRCTEMPVVRFGVEEIQDEIGPLYVLMEHRHEVHLTPMRQPQSYNYFRFRRAEIPEAFLPPPVTRPPG